MVPITGYADRFSVRPGERIEFKTSSQSAAPYSASIVRILSGDANPDGPGLVYEAVPSEIDGTYPSRRQDIRLGSYARVEHSPSLRLRGPFLVSILAYPTLLRDTPQGLVSKSNAARRGFCLAVTKGGAVFELGCEGGTLRVEVPKPIIEHRWYRFWASVDPGARRVVVGQHALTPDFGVESSETAARLLESPAVPGCDAPLLFGALGETPGSGLFNGKLEAPAIVAAAVGECGGVLDPLMAGLPVVGAWDFSIGIDTQRIHDVGPNRLHGALINLPTRAVKGARWSGREQSWRHAPADYAAIHFHEDDLYDCGWQTEIVFTVPHGMPSGVYGLRIACEGEQDVIPFYVRPPAGRPAAPILFLASTFTYQAYANHARGNCDDAYRARAKDWGGYPWNPDDHPEYGLSTYNHHSDGSGVAYSSRLRPILTMRPGFMTFVDRRGSGLRHFPADTHLLGWLAAKGLAFDVATDEDLDDEGADLLRAYSVVLTGSHPEYHTTGTLDALRSYVGQGGRLVYLGGNGFYWRIARSAHVHGAIEVRRGEGGIRPWAAEPGEYYQSFDGEYGGLWRRIGRPPQQLVGVGFSAQGLFEGSYYRRLPVSYDASYAWIFEGIDEEKIGDFGLSGGGAAGFELDRLDRRLGSPLNATVLARSEGHQAHFVVVPEELLSHIATITGERPQDLIRGEIVYFETPNGGAVLSVGSITFCGSLPHNGFANNVSRLLENVVRRFASRPQKQAETSSAASQAEA